MMDRRERIAVIKAAREIRMAARKLQSTATGEEAEAAIKELRSIAFALEMLPGRDVAPAACSPAPIWPKAVER